MTRIARPASLGPALIVLCAACASFRAPDSGVGPEGGRRILFSGYYWDVKGSAGRVGPGPNYFSDSEESASVDGSGALRLRLRREGGRWLAAELGLARSLGYGTYRVELASRVDDLDPGVVVGLFTWSDAPAHANRELDVEFAKWGDRAAASNAQYVVQPAAADSTYSFRITQGEEGAVVELRWTPEGAAFDSRRGRVRPGRGLEELPPLADGPGGSAWAYSGPKLPPPGDERFRINLYLFRGEPPADGREVELVVGSFSFERWKGERGSRRSGGRRGPRSGDAFGLKKRPRAD